MSWLARTKDLDNLRGEVDGRLDELESRIENLEKQMAIITVDEAAQEILNTGSVENPGGDDYMCVQGFASNGDQITVTYLNPWTDSTLSEQYASVYRNGVKEVDLPIATASSGYDYAYLGQPVLLTTHSIWYVKLSVSSQNWTIHLYEYNLSSKSSTESWSQEIEARMASPTFSMAGAGICDRPSSDKIYIYGVGWQGNFGGTQQTTYYAWECDADGTEDHRILYTQGVGDVLYCPGGMCVQAGTLYVYGYYWTPNTYTFRVVKTDVSASDGAFSQEYTETGATALGSFGPFGLLQRQADHKLISVISDQVWDISTYSDAYHNTAVLQKIDSSENFYLLTWKSSNSTVYLLKLDSGGTVTSKASRSGISLSSHLMHQLGRPSNWKASEGEHFKYAFVGSGSKLFSVVSKGLDVI